MNIRHRGFSRGNQIQLAHRIGAIAFHHAIVLVLEFRKLADAFEALRSNDERRRDFRVSVVAAVQIEQELD